MNTRERLATLLGEMTAMLDGATAGGRQLSAEEIAVYDAKQVEAEGLEAAIAREDKLASLKVSAAKPVPSVMESAGEAAETNPGRVAEAGPTEFENLGEMMAAVRFRPSDSRLASLWQDPSEGLSAEQRFDTGSTGGFMIPQQFRNTLLEVKPQDSIVRPRATVIPAGSPPDAAMTIPALDQRGGAADANMYGGVEVFKTEEGGQKGETDYKIRNITLQPSEISSYMELTDKLLRNWSAASAFVTRQFRAAMLGYEDLQFLRGNGTGGPLGSIPSAAAYEVTRETSDTVTYNDLVEMLNRLLEQGGDPVWVGSRALQSVIRKLRNATGDGGDGSLIWAPSAQTGDPDTLLGYPILWNQRSPAKNARGDMMLADFQGYLIKDGSGPFVASSEHVKFRENKTAMKIFWNVDGQPWLTAPIKGEDDYETSPFVVLGAGS